MSGTNDNTPVAEELSSMTEEDYREIVEQVEDLIGGYKREDILCVLLTATVNAIHVIEDKTVRARIEREYLKALTFLSAVEEQFQPEDATASPDWGDGCVSKIMHHVFHAIGLG
jgi:hypothetical protein